METTDIFISRLLDTASGFAARIDTGEQVFVPATVVRASGAKEGDMGRAKLIPNTHPNGSNTPWVAVFVDLHDPAPVPIPAPAPEPVRPEPTLDDRVFDAVCGLGYATTSEVAKEVKADIALTHNALLRLFGKGRMAKADVFARPEQDRASFCMWAEDVTHFLGEGGE
jgi:hypothetical protein